MISIDIPRVRLRNQHLTGPKQKSPGEVVAWQGAVQAQDYSGAKWAVAQRTDGWTDKAIEQAVTNGDLLRTHLMRPTWHFVAPTDIRWMLALTAPRLNASSTYRYRQLELDDDTFTRSRTALARALQGEKQLTRPELGDILEKAGIAEPNKQRLAYLVMRAEQDQVIVSGARRGKQITYALFEERVPSGETLPRDEALAELARRYFQSHGPALIKDYCWWANMSVGDAKKGMELLGSTLKQETINQKTYWYIGERETQPSSKPIAYLLPNYDEGIASYSDYTSSMKPGSQVEWGSENTLSYHYLVIDGWIAGTWKRSLRKGSVLLEYLPFENLSTDQHEAIAKAASQYEAFIELKVELAQVVR